MMGSVASGTLCIRYGMSLVSSYVAFDIWNMVMCIRSVCDFLLFQFSFVKKITVYKSKNGAH
jgi:hypothetical protein